MAIYQELSCCQETEIWLLVYVEGYGIYSSPNIRHRPDTMKYHFLREHINKEIMHSLVASKVKDKSKSYFVKQNKFKEHKLSSNYMKVFWVLYWICKEKVVVVRTFTLLNLIEKLGITELKDFEK